MSEFGGLSGKYKYYEFQLDALDFSYKYDGNYPATDWPLFHIGGTRPLQNIAAVKILEVQIPFSFYVYNENNNTFTLNENGGGELVVTIPVGNYTVTEMETVFADALDLAGTGTYTVTADNNTQKLMIQNASGAVTAPFTLTFGNSEDTGNTNPRLYLGFTRGVSSSSYDSPNFDFITAPNVYSITGPNYLYVNSTILGGETNLFLPKGAYNLGYGNAGPQIAKVPITVQPDGVIFWSDPDPNKWFATEGLTHLSKVDFFLSMGNTSHVLGMNGQNFALKLGILEADFSIMSESQGTSDSRVTKRVRIQ